jgi:hypothetical protein
MPSGPYYDNVRQGGPDGIRFPLEVQRAMYAVEKEVDLGSLASGSTTYLTPDQAGASVITATPGGACTIVYPCCQPGFTVLIINLASGAGYTITIQCGTNTTNVAVCPISKTSLVIHTGTNGGALLGPNA